MPEMKIQIMEDEFEGGTSFGMANPVELNPNTRPNEHQKIATQSQIADQNNNVANSLNTVSSRQKKQISSYFQLYSFIQFICKI